MKAIVLAAGRGSRLGNLTQQTPKCILSVGNQSMLEHWFRIFHLYNVTDILINTHYLADKVMSHCTKIVNNYNLKLTFIYEKELLGTAQTIAFNRNFVDNESLFLIVYADTWMQVDLKEMVKYQKHHMGLGTIGIYKPESLKDQGSVDVKDRKILSIEEKVDKPKGKFAFAGIMLGSRSMFKFYNNTMIDLARDWLPTIKEGLNPFFIDGLVLDIGTPERYKLANEKVRNLGLKAL